LEERPVAAIVVIVVEEVTIPKTVLKIKTPARVTIPVMPADLLIKNQNSKTKSK